LERNIIEIYQAVYLPLHIDISGVHDILHLQNTNAAESHVFLISSAATATVECKSRIDTISNQEQSPQSLKASDHLIPLIL
jgi:hypothetical protein